MSAQGGGEGSASSSSHNSLGELAGGVVPPDVELSELEQRKVVVLGVPWQTDDLTLQQHFRQYGPVDEAQIMREKYSGKSRGFGFVTFRHTADALKAVAAEHMIDGRKCEAKFALPEGKVGSARTTRIFVARIPASVGDAQFRQYFEQFGVCQDCYMPKDPSKQGHRGIGFVTYSSPESVELVMSQTHVLNGNEIAIDRATPKERVALLPGRLSGGQPGAGLGSAGAGVHASMQLAGLMRGMGVSAGSASLSSNLMAGGRQAGHAGLQLGGAGMLGSPPGQQLLQGNGSAHGGSYHGGSYHGGSYHGGSPQSGSYHGGSYHGGSYHGGSYHGGSYHGGSHSLAGGGDGSFHGAQAGGASAYGSSLGNTLASLGSAGMNISANLLAQAQAAALQQQLSSSAGLASSLEGSSPSQLISLLSANSAAAAGSAGMGAGRYSGPPVGSAPSSQGDLASLLGVQQDAPVHGGWLRGSLPPPTGNSLTGSGSGGSLGPASARAGPRIFIGKLNKETSEQDVKEHFMRFGFVLDVYLPRDKNNKREHRGFGFVTFETEAAIQRVVAHGPHHIKGSIVAIDSAVPRQEEVVLAMGDGHAGLSASAALAAADPAAEALHAMEALALEGSGRGRALLRPHLSAASVGMAQPY